MEHELESPSPPLHRPTPQLYITVFLLDSTEGAAVNQGNIVVQPAPHPQPVLSTDTDKEPVSIMSRPGSKH